MFICFDYLALTAVPKRRHIGAKMCQNVDAFSHMLNHTHFTAKTHPSQISNLLTMEGGSFVKHFNNFV